LLFNKFFFLTVDTCLVEKIQPHTVEQHISDLHSKFALRAHHVWKYGRHPISDRLEYARKKERNNNVGQCAT